MGDRKAATLGGARALCVGDAVGGVEPGLRANLLLFERDRLFEPEVLMGSKTVIKDGVSHTESEEP